MCVCVCVCTCVRVHLCKGGSNLCRGEEFRKKYSRLMEQTVPVMVLKAILRKDVCDILDTKDSV